MRKLLDFIRKNKRYVLSSMLLSFLLFMSVDVKMYEDNKPEEVSYDAFIADLDSGAIDTVYYSPSEEKMRYTKFNEETSSMDAKEREEYTYEKKDWRMTTYPAQESFRKDMLEKGVNLVIRSFEPVSTRFLTLGATAILPLFLFFMMMRMVYNGLPKLKSDDLVQTSDIKFSDVIGHDEVISDLKFIVSLLRDPEKGNKLGAEVPRGILFSGDPGTGKTLLAKAIAGESGVPFIYMNASSFIELYVGTGAKRVRELFGVAKRHSPCILFLDEIDAVGRSRGSSRGTSENDQTINALLQEMDGFKDRGRVFVIAATNNPDTLDKALVRAGRFDRQVVVGPPKDFNVRKELFDFYLKDCRVSDDVDTLVLAKQLVGFTGADISAVVNESKLIATMKDSEFICMADMEEAVDKIIFKGNRSASESRKRDKEIVAYHEAGHAVASYLLGEPVARATIAGTTSGVGGVVFREEKDSQFQTNKDFENHVCIAYAGRCAEKIKFDTITTGAASDITQATNIILAYIEKYGFNSDFGMLDMAVLHEKALIDSSHIVELMSAMAVKYEGITMELLRNNFSLVEKLATKLIECETLSGDGIKELFTA